MLVTLDLQIGHSSATLLRADDVIESMVSPATRRRSDRIRRCNRARRAVHEPGYGIIPEVPARLAYVSYWGYSGKHMLAVRFSQFDPKRTSIPTHLSEKLVSKAVCA
jgi:hypothetical protein